VPHPSLRAALGIGGLPANLLLAENLPALASDITSSLQPNTQGLLGYTQSLVQTGDELMFTVEIPSAPLPQTAIVLAQAVTSTASPTLVASSNRKPDYILKDCQEFPNPIAEGSAEHLFSDAAGLLANYYYEHYKRDIDLSTIHTSILEEPKHGVITSVTDTLGNIWNSYEPDPGFLGEDKVVFQAEFGGKTYKIVMKLIVSVVTRDLSKAAPVCPTPQLIKVNNKPVSGSSDYNFGNISVNLADLTGAALGQTTGTRKSWGQKSWGQNLENLGVKS
jgi:hypothetical protein